jgi:hypothetical protein
MSEPHAFGIAGVLGWPVAHSRSPVIHDHWLAQYGIPGRSALFPVPPEKLEAAARGMAALGLLLSPARSAFNARIGVMPEITPALRQAIAATI